MKNSSLPVSPTDHFGFWYTWLFVVAVLITAFGIAFAFLSGTRLFDLFNQQIDPTFWGIQNVARSSRDFQHWIYGVLGAVMAGWGSMLAFIVRYPFRAKEAWAWWCIGAGILLWFLIDTIISLYFQVFFNVAFNLVILMAVALPLGITMRHFRVRKGRKQFT
jgi:hypothetical protein